MRRHSSAACGGNAHSERSVIPDTPAPGVAGDGAGHPAVDTTPSLSPATGAPTLVDRLAATPPAIPRASRAPTTTQATPDAPNSAIGDHARTPPEPATAGEARRRGRRTRRDPLDTQPPLDRRPTQPDRHASTNPTRAGTTSELNKPHWNSQPVFTNADGRPSSREHSPNHHSGPTSPHEPLPRGQPVPSTALQARPAGDDREVDPGRRAATVPEAPGAPCLRGLGSPPGGGA